MESHPSINLKTLVKRRLWSQKMPFFYIQMKRHVGKLEIGFPAFLS